MIRGKENGWKPIRVSSPGKIKAKNIRVVDQFDRNLESLFLMRNPKYRWEKDYQREFKKFRREHRRGNWFYFPWSRELVHFLPEKLHQELRTGRNRNLITSEEQQKYYRATIGIAGLSVGSHAALTIALTGGAKHLKLADPDWISGDNLNRIRTGFGSVGTKKAVLLSRSIFEMNPYSKVELYGAGLNERNLRKFLRGLDVLIELMDSPYLKLKIREEARKMKIPVLMGTDNGDNSITDVERFDLNSKYPILHGFLGKLDAERFKKLSPRELPRISARLAGANLAVSRMLESVLEVGKTLYSWPQLGTAASLNGAILAYLARRISVGDHKIRSGRYQVNFDAVFESDYRKKASARRRAFKRFLQKISSDGN